MTTSPPASPQWAENWSGLREYLTRSTDDRVVTGVAGGLAARLGMGSGYVRAGFAGLALTGLGLVLYPVLYAPLRRHGAERHPGAQPDRRPAEGRARP